MLKKRITVLLLFTLVVSCSTVTPDNYSTKSVLNNVQSSSTPTDLSQKLDTPEPPKISAVPVNSGKTQKEDKFIIDRNELNYPQKDSFVPGMISIIYKNSYKMSVNKKLNKIESVNQNALSLLSGILDKYKAKKLTSLLPDNANFNELKRIQTELSNEYNVDFPELGSMHCYEFPEDVDTVKLAEELRKLPFIDTAYPTPIGQVSSTPAPTFVSRQGINDIHKNLPAPANDTSFGSFSEEYKWSWFNHHKIFQAWDIYRQNFGNVSDISYVSQSNLPTIAVVDDGFYKGSDADAPTYLTGVHYNTNGSYVDTDTSQHTQYNSNNPNLARSHGTSMANIIASPKNNGIGFCGVIPGAKIYPVKIDYGYNSSTNKYYLTTASMTSAIINAGGNSNVDVINASLAIGSPETPISYDSQVNIAIQYAIGQGKSVVISAGNSKNNLDSISPPTDYGAVIVGASSSYNGQIWDSGSGDGSNWGQVISLAAQGEEIFAPTWQVSTNSLYLLNQNDGTSPAAAEVSGILGMMKKLAQQKGVSYTPQELRDVIAYTGTLGVSSLTPSNPKKFLGRGLNNTSSNVNLYAEMRDLNAWAALTVINNANYSQLVRIFNNDDYTWATTNWDWNGKYTQENYFDEAFWRFSTMPSGTVLSFYTNNTGGNGSLGYQLYNYGKFGGEGIYGVLSRYNTSRTNQTPYYYTIGTNTGGWFLGWGWQY